MLIIVDKDYTKLLNELKDHKISELIIHPNEFPDFQAAFMRFATRKRIVGKAEQNGKVIYTYLSDGDHDS